MADIGKFRGMLLGQASGDALGYPLDRLSAMRIQKQYGPFGLRTLVRSKKNHFRAQITQNTQLMLATTDGILWAAAKEMDHTESLYRGYMRWYYCQTGDEARHGQRTWMRRQPHERDFCLAREKFMHAKRGTGSTLIALGNEDPGSLKNKINDANDSEALIRSGPIGLMYAGEIREAFYEAIRAAMLTHTNPIAYQSAGAFAGIIAGLSMKRTSLPKVLEEVLALLNKSEHTDSICAMIEAAVEQANRHPAGNSDVWSNLDGIHALGTGKKAEEALAIGIYCVLSNDNPFDALIASANHDGKSSVTAAVTGAIEGTRFGPSFLPSSWTSSLECSEIIENIALHLYSTWEREKVTRKKQTNNG